MKTDSELWARLEQLEEEEKDWLVEEERRGVTSELELATSFPEQPESAPPRDTLSPASPPPTPWNIPIFHTSHNVSIDHNSSVLSDSGEEQHARFTNPGDIFKEFSKAEPLTSKDKGEDVKENSNSGTGDFQQRKQDPQLPKPRTVTWDTRLEHHKTGSVRHERGSDRPKQQPVQWQTPAAVVSKPGCVLCMCICNLNQGSLLIAALFRNGC